MRHDAVVVALHLIERHVLVAHELQHAPEVGLFLITAVKFQLPVTRDDDDGWRIRTNIGERGILVDSGLQGRYALLFSDIIMRDTLSAERYQPSQ